MGRDGEEIILNPFELGVAHDHIARKNNPTPLLFFGVIPDGEYKIKLWVKMDTLNEGGSFKDRGSEYFVHKAVNDGRVKKREMIVTASAGNHGKGVARTARD
ncbi:MAG TPA: pyridoxal-phosphate dependent enzyme, partial [Candidatus Nanoarchaeia archaeon]|nr:pyridoxal-phosphate dependent enzyme [Candidatus Nanoarchaeia archaeon]